MDHLDDIVDKDNDPQELYDLICLVGTGSFGHVWKGVARVDVRSRSTNEVRVRAGQTIALKIVPAVDRDTFLKLMQEISWLAQFALLRRSLCRT